MTRGQSYTCWMFSVTRIFQVIGNNIKICLALGANLLHYSREKSAEVLSKMVLDKLIGPKVRICVTRFLPTIFLDAMKQSPEAAVSMLDSEHENPELIWNEDTRQKVELHSNRIHQSYPVCFRLLV